MVLPVNLPKNTPKICHAKGPLNRTRFSCASDACSYLNLFVHDGRGASVRTGEQGAGVTRLCPPPQQYAPVGVGRIRPLPTGPQGTPGAGAAHATERRRSVAISESRRGARTYAWCWGTTPLHTATGEERHLAPQPSSGGSEPAAAQRERRGISSGTLDK